VKPIIGVTCPSKFDPFDTDSQGKIELNWNYSQVVADAGGVPILVPPIADPAAVAPLLDGWMITGGADLDPALYSAEPHAQTEVGHPQRADFEFALLKLLPEHVPILGICYGCQFLNVARGGSLHQHLPDLGGKAQHTGNVPQEYRVQPGSHLARILGDAPIAGVSSHHQAIERLGGGLMAVAWHEDGTIEAIEDPEHPWLIGVQWHPERSPTGPASERLFRSFVEAAARIAQARGARC
jgi:gamma-glutamyl-gamma-aminobutyrate hydrolase PuuD